LGVCRICCQIVVSCEGLGCRFIPNHEAFEFRHCCAGVIGGTLDVVRVGGGNIRMTEDRLNRFFGYAELPMQASFNLRLTLLIYSARGAYRGLD
jgi:hypothetical protein